MDDLSRTGVSWQYYGARVLINPNVEDYDLVVVVDTSVGTQLGQAACQICPGGPPSGRRAAGRRSFHTKARQVHGRDRLDDSKRKRQEVRPKSGPGTSGRMIADTGRFKRATPGAFLAAAELLEQEALLMKRHWRPFLCPRNLSKNCRPQSCLSGRGSSPGRLAHRLHNCQLFRGFRSHGPGGFRRRRSLRGRTAGRATLSASAPGLAERRPGRA